MADPILVKPPTRTVTQIAATRDSENYNTALFALCDDGTIWHMHASSNERQQADWLPIPPIPQP